MALPQPHRLNHDRDIQEVFRLGKTVRGSFLLLTFRQQLTGIRFAYQISTKVLKGAVDRNRMRRKLSQATREMLHSPTLRGGKDVVVRLVKAPFDKEKEIVQEYQTLLRAILYE